MVKVSKERVGRANCVPLNFELNEKCSKNLHSKIIPRGNAIGIPLGNLISRLRHIVKKKKKICINYETFRAVCKMVIVNRRKYKY